MTQRLLFLGLSATLLGGCYSGANDAGPVESTERYGKHCYYSYSSSSSASYSTASSGKNESQVDDGFKLTVAATPMSAVHDGRALDEIRLQAAQLGRHHIQLSCMESEQTIQACSNTCNQRGLRWLEEEDEDCDECVVRIDGTIDCGEPDESLREAMAQRWYGTQPWTYTDEQNRVRVRVYPPHLTENYRGERVWEADVQSIGSCSCACGY